jgi:hypothetical protein
MRVRNTFCGGMVLTGEIAISWRETNHNATFFYPTCRAIAWGGGLRLVGPPRAAESKGRQDEQQNKFFKLIFCAEQMFSYEPNKEKLNKQM